jgi:hypothetical protein
MTTSVPQVKLGVSASLIVDRLVRNFSRMYAEAARKKDIRLFEHTTSLVRQAYEALKLRCNDGEVPFDSLEAFRRALENIEKAISSFKEAE